MAEFFEGVSIHVDVSGNLLRLTSALSISFSQLEERLIFGKLEGVKLSNPCSNWASVGLSAHPCCCLLTAKRCKGRLFRLGEKPPHGTGVPERWRVKQRKEDTRSWKEPNSTAQPPHEIDHTLSLHTETRGKTIKSAPKGWLQKRPTSWDAVSKTRMAGGRLVFSGSCTYALLAEETRNSKFQNFGGRATDSSHKVFQKVFAQQMRENDLHPMIHSQIYNLENDCANCENLAFYTIWLAFRIQQCFTSQKFNDFH